MSTYIMGFITFPYVSRIFGAEKLGLVSFVDNTISYFLLFATMGISNIGVREIESHFLEFAGCQLVVYAYYLNGISCFCQYCSSHETKCRYVLCRSCKDIILISASGMAFQRNGEFQIYNDEKCIYKNPLCSSSFRIHQKTRPI